MIPAPSAEKDELPLVLSYGLGLESTAILARWLLEPRSSPVEARDILVISAMLGSEFADSIELVETHILPLLREHGVRYIQAARAAHSQTDGVKILSDSRSTERLYAEGGYRLYDEMITTATIPQLGGTRLCSIKNKGWVLDKVIERELRGARYRHVIGFNAQEQSRIERDHSFGGDARSVWYPLDEWKWGREECTEFLKDAFGVEWPKSCCEFCVFARAQPHIMERYRRYPDAAARALFAEMIARAFNPTQLLYKDYSLLDRITEDGNHPALEHFHGMLEAESWALYRMRRLWSTSRNAQRCIQRIHTGTRTEALNCLKDLATARGAEMSPTEDRLSWRIVLDAKDRSHVGRQREEAYILAPATVDDKAPYDRFDLFEARWAEWLAEMDLFAA